MSQRPSSDSVTHLPICSLSVPSASASRSEMVLRGALSFEASSVRHRGSTFSTEQNKKERLNNTRVVTRVSYPCCADRVSSAIAHETILLEQKRTSTFSTEQIEKERLNDTLVVTRVSYPSCADRVSNAIAHETILLEPAPSCACTYTTTLHAPCDHFHFMRLGTFLLTFVAHHTEFARYRQGIKFLSGWAKTSPNVKERFRPRDSFAHFWVSGH